MILINAKDVKVGFDVFAVASASDKENNTPHPENSKNDTVLIVPSAVADASVICPNSYPVDPLSEPLRALAAAKFLLAFRGLPLCELEIESQASIFEVIRLDNRVGTFIEKCKQLYTNNTIFVDNIELSYSEYLLKNIIIRVFECSEARLVKEESLKKLLYRSDVGGCDIAVCFSLNNDSAEIKYAANCRKTKYISYACALCVAGFVFENENVSVLSVKAGESSLGFFRGSGNFDICVYDFI